MQTRTLLFLAAATVANSQSTSLTDALGSQDSLSTLASLLSNSSLAQSLDSLSNVTILAPNNDALSAVLNSGDAGNSLSAPGYIDALLSYHILNGTYYASNITNSSTFVPTYLTNTTYTNLTAGQVVEAARVNDNVTFFSALKLNSSVVTPDLNFTGGTVHIIDSILFIPGNITDTLAGSNLTAAVGALEAVALPDSLGRTQDITIFAPNNDAFNAVGSIASNLTTDQLTSILGYHVLNGTVAYSSDLSNSTVSAADGTNLTITVIDGTVFVNDAKVTVPNILLENGVCHVIDQVLNPNNTVANPDPSQSSATPAYSGASSTTEIPFTSGVETATTTFPAATSAAGGGTGQTSSSSEGLGVPIQTGAVGAAALFGGAAILVNL
ncbi:fasciclin domain-containing protein [Xylariaceae sp. FL1019]|nr:fasciclin domain-containing protein [Xylariaceae sp. FL1019]